MKKCSSCRLEKPVTEFNTNKAYKDGFQNMCRSCASAYYKAYNEARKASKAVVDSTSKVCRDCRSEKPLSQFGNKNNTLDKKNIYCKPCWSQRCKIATRKALANAKRKD